MKTIQTIDDVISALEEIIMDSKNTQDPLGYFAVLYQKVTIKVKEGIASGFFDDGARMEQLDVIFANRYLQAYYAFHNNEPITASWQRAFELSINTRPIVLQHLLMGINAHINLDLGIAAAAISNQKNIDGLENDFNKINDILSSMVNEVEQQLSEIWPTLKRILKKVGRLDDFLVDFSMKLARSGAWKFAKRIVGKAGKELEKRIAVRDQKVARKANIISYPGLIMHLIFGLVRLGEQGSVFDKIQDLEAINHTIEKKTPPAISSWRALKNSVRFIKNPILVLQEYLKDMGDTFTIYLSPSEKPIITADPHLIQYVLQKNNRNYRKSRNQVEQFAHFIGNGLLTSDGPYWLKQRRLIQPGFHRKKLAELMDVMVREIDQFLDEFNTEKIGQNSFDLAHEMMELTFQIVAKALFSTGIEKSKMNALQEHYDKIQTYMARQIKQPFLKSWLKFSGELKKHEDESAKLKAIVSGIIQERKQSKEQHSDLLQMLLEARYEASGEGMSEKQLIEESLILLIAGHETSANTLAWTWYLLCQHPEVVQKLKAVIKNELGDQKPSLGALANMPYLRQVIQESMRLYPTGWVTDRVPVKDDHFEGFKLPKDRIIGIYIYGVHRSPKYWVNPEKFDPSRFTKEKIKKRPAFAYLPFGGGQRLCIGSHFAMMEMQLILIRMLQRFDFELVEDQQVELEPLITLRPKTGIWVRGKQIDQWTEHLGMSIEKVKQGKHRIGCPGQNTLPIRC